MYRILTSLLVMTSALINSAALAQQQFDGRWSVYAVPEKGSCRRAQHYTIVIENGVARNAVSRPGTDKVTGGLEADGRVRANLRRDRIKVDVTGKLVGRSGSGRWTIAGSKGCAGRWTASKWG